MQSVFILFPIFIGLLLLDGNSVLASRAYRRRSRRERREQQALYELNHKNACNYVISTFSDGSNACLASPLKSYADLYLKSDLIRLWDFKQTDCIPRSDIMIKPYRLTLTDVLLNFVTAGLLFELLLTETSSLKYLLWAIPA
jgi:hypothetical protein